MINAQVYELESEGRSSVMFSFFINSNTNVFKGVMKVVFRDGVVNLERIMSTIEKTSTMTPENSDKIAVQVMETNCYKFFLDFLREIGSKMTSFSPVRTLSA